MKISSFVKFRKAARRVASSRAVISRAAVCRASIEQVESRLMFAYDLAFVDASAAPGTYSPGQNISATFTFKNNGDTATPASKFYAFLAKPGFFDDTGSGGTDNSLYGGFLYTPDSATAAVDLPSIAPGATVTLPFNQPLSAVSFNGGPYNIYVYGGFTDTNFLINDADFSNNFGLSSSAPITVTGSLDPLGGGGSGGSDLPTDPVVGDLDTTFGNNGQVTSTLFGASVQTVSTIFDTTTGFQYALAQSATDLVLLRFDTTGQLDTSYGNNGFLALDLGGNSAQAASLVNIGGSIFATGALADGSAAVVAKLTASGSLDPTFGTGGIATISAASVLGTGTLGITSLAGGPGGSIYLAGSFTPAAGASDFALIRLTASGSPDASFASDGGTSFDLGGADVANAVVVTPKGQIVLAGGSVSGDSSTAAALRVNANGTADAKFGTKGKTIITARQGGAEQFTVAALGAKDVIYLAGYSAIGSAPSTTSQAFVSRLTSAGKADTKFGAKGTALLTTVPTALASPNTISVTPEGGALVSLQTADSLSGVAANAIGVSLVRLDAKGNLVTNFGTNGISQILAPGVTLAAAANTESAFTDFLNSKDGATTQIPGGKVRTLASSASDTDNSTTLQLTQLVADGADIIPDFDGAIPTAVAGGDKATAKIKISNLGTLPAAGAAGLTLSLVPVGTSTPVAGDLASSTLKLKLNAGASSKTSVKFAFPRGAQGTYALVAKVTPSAGVNDVGTGNNATNSPNQVNVSPRGAELALTLAGQPGPAAAGKVLQLLLGLQNTGNIPASGKGTVQLFVVSAGETPSPTDAPIATTTIPLGVGLQQSKNLKANFKLPSNFALSPGERLYLRLILPDSLGDRNSSNNDAFSDVLIAG